VIPSNGPFEASPLPADAVELGRFLDAWGVKGWVHIQPHSADTRALFESPDWFLLPPETRFGRGFSAFSGPVRVRVAEIKVHSDGVVARLEGVADRNAAEALRGCASMCPAALSRPPPMVSTTGST
jgi:16S rRNA processing protein RimM